MRFTWLTKAFSEIENHAAVLLPLQFHNLALKRA